MAIISNEFLDVLRSRKRDLALLYEFYNHDVLPGENGFDPADAVECFAAIRTEYRGRVYKREIRQHAKAHRTSGAIFNSVSVTFSALDGIFPAFANSRQVEGMSLVVRVVSRRLLNRNRLDDSFAVFTGQCEKPVDVDNASYKISAKQHFGSIDQEIPPRTYSRNDPLRSDPEDPLFEGFQYKPVLFTVSWQEKVRKQGFGGLFGLSNKVTRTNQYSSRGDLEENEAVPIVLGRAQLLLKTIASLDTGRNVDVIQSACDGGSDRGIKAWSNLRLLTPGWQGPKDPQYRFGKPGGVDEQVPLPRGLRTFPLVGNKHYSRTAAVVYWVTGSTTEEVHDAPEAAAVLLGTIVPVPDSNGNFVLWDWTDNPAYLARWVITDPRMMGLNPAYIDDQVCWETGKYCDQYIQDASNTDTAVLPAAEANRIGTLYRLYNSTGRVTPGYWRGIHLGDNEVQPHLTELDPIFFPPEDDPPILLPPAAAVTPLRRRWTANCAISEKQKAIDFLNKILFASTRLYAIQGTSGKIEIRVKKPVDNTRVRSASLVGTNEIAVESVLAWRTNLVGADPVSDRTPPIAGPLRGKVLIATNQLTSEVRAVLGTRYSVTGNNITLQASGGAVASGPTFAGGDGNQVPAQATVTVNAGGWDVPTVTIDGIEIAYASSGADIQGSVAGEIAARINAHPTLNRYIKAVWNPAVSVSQITLYAKMGFLILNTPLQNPHAIGEEIIRIRMAFSSGASQISDNDRSNILKNTIKYPLGQRQSTANQVKFSYRDAANDFQFTTLIVNDELHQAAIGGKPIPVDINGTCCDNFHQAERAANGAIAELRDGDYFVQLSSDGEALLIDEGEVIAITSEKTGGFVNLAVRVEDALFNDDFSVQLIGRRYLTSMYDDTANQRTVPIPTTLVYPTEAPPHVANLALTEVGAFGADGTWKARIRVNFDFAAIAADQSARVQIKRTVEDVSLFRDLSVAIRPDSASHGQFDIPDMAKDSYNVRVIAETRFNRADPSTAPVQTISIVSVPPPPAAVNGQGVKDTKGNWLVTWDKGKHVPDVIAQGEEIPIYRIRIKAAPNGAIVREHTLQTNALEALLWRFRQDVQDQTGFPCTQANTTISDDGSIVNLGNVTDSCIYSSQPLRGEAKILFQTSHYLAPRLITLDYADGSEGLYSQFQASYVGQVPRIRAEFADFTKWRAMPQQTFGFWLAQSKVHYLGPRGDIVWTDPISIVDQSKPYRVTVFFDWLNGEPAELKHCRAEFTDPERFIYSADMQREDFANVLQNTIHVEIVQVSLNPEAPEGMKANFTFNA